MPSSTPFATARSPEDASTRRAPKLSKPWGSYEGGPVKGRRRRRMWSLCGGSLSRSKALTSRLSSANEAGWASVVAAVSSVYARDFECALIRDDVGRETYSELDGLRAAWLDWLSLWASYPTRSRTSSTLGRAEWWCSRATSPTQGYRRRGPIQWCSCVDGAEWQ